MADDIRIDKWLWAARFFKSRSLAAKAVESGAARVGGERVKPAREVKPGEVLRIRNGTVEWEVIVLALSAVRGPAAHAAGLYEETAASREKRERARERRRLAPEPAAQRQGQGRPTKRDRRLIHRFTDGG
ncbi:MAG TPA: RNA-binding S4 domain-containing protein [Burkholderiales bacterium]|nr:RNA-binding S4 domain-containing protein [Burkholderiales bacterium]